MNDSNLSEFLLDINTGIAYKVVELNGINYLCNISNVCNVLDITSLGEDNQYDSVILNVSNPANSHSLQLSSNIITFDSNNQNETNSISSNIITFDSNNQNESNSISSNIITFDSNNQNESNRGIIGVSEAEHVAEEIDTELDEIISFVQEDISHDKKIIESFGKLPPVTGVTDAGEDLYNQSYEESTSSCSRIVPECIALENTHAVPECINEVLVISIHNTNYVLDNRDNVVACSLQDEECQFKDKEEARERMKLDDETREIMELDDETRETMELDDETRETMEVDDESCDETRIQKKIKVKLKPSSGAAQWGHCLDTVDENQVTLETREQIMTSVEKKMAVRKKRDCTNLVEFNTNKDKLTVFICNICNAVFDQMSKYHGHMRKHTEQVMWKCRQCPPDESSSATFRTQSLLKTHIRRVHTMLSDRKYSCELCSDRFLYASHLFEHLKTAHKSERQLKCLLCPKRFYKKSDLVAHLSIHLQLKKHLCDICGKRFSQSSNLLAHKRSHTGSRPYPCKQCGRRFRQINSLNVHRATHAPDQDTDDTETDISSRDSGRQPRKHYCLVCGETFRYLFLLKNHMTELHESQKLFQCSECVQIYHNVYEFLSHSCISGAVPNSSSSLPNLTEDSSEELILLLNEILNTTSGSGGGNRNEEILNILLNLAEENGTNAELNLEENGTNTEEVECGASSVAGEVNSVGGEMMCDGLQVDTTAQIYSTPLDNVDNLDLLPSGEMTAEQIFANISTCSLLPSSISSNNFTSISYIPPARVSFVPTPGLGKSLFSSSAAASSISTSSLSNAPFSSASVGNFGVVMPNSDYPSTSSEHSSLTIEPNFVSSSTLSASSNHATMESMACNSTTTSFTIPPLTTKYFPPGPISSSRASYPNMISSIPCISPSSDSTSDISPRSNNVTPPNSSDFLSSNDAGGIFNSGIPNSYMPTPCTASTSSPSSPSCTTNSIFTYNISSSSNLTFDSSSCSDILSGVPSPSTVPPTVLSCLDLKKFPIRMIVNVDNIDLLKKIIETSPQGDETLSKLLVKLNKTNDIEGKPDSSPNIEDKLVTNDPPCSSPTQTNPTKRKRLPLSISCDKCQATFTRWTTYRLHTSTVHNTDRMLYTCPDCGKSFSYENGLKTHIRNKHERNEEVKTKFPCEVESCDLVFTSISALNTHVKRNHGMEKPHACADCGKSFFSKYDWKKHSRIHSGEKPFHCEHCPRQFRNSSHLFRHQRSLHQ